MNDPEYRRMVEFLVGLGTESVPHTGEKGFLTHLIGVYRDLEIWGCDVDVCRAGLFHSIYGTELFQKFCLPLDRRSEVQQLIGAGAERLAFVNCVMDRSSFDRLIPSRGPYRIANRLSDEMIELDEQDFHDLCVVHLCDWLEQVPRSEEWDYRRAAYRNLADRLGGIAKESFDRVYAVASV
ncbi:MAG: hypothetical protein SH850_14595 [Planctomycetaceae bacterium]|nr:hypothetical protein [Planctomycetaceae bacterium]